MDDLKAKHSTLRRLPAALCILALGAGLVFGIFLLFDLRFESGDNYPAYSTLRADPLGSRALFDSLRAVPGLAAARNLRPLCELREGAGATLFYLGLELDDMTTFGMDELRHLEEFLLAGGRLVVTLAPQVRRPGASDLKPRAAAGGTSCTLPTSATLAGGGSVSKAQAEAEARRKAEEKKEKAKPAPT